MSFQKGNTINLGRKQTREHREKVRQYRIGKKHNEEIKKKISLSHLGLRPTLKTRLKMGHSRRGKKHYNWKGGITSLHQIIRGSIEYKLWREAVMKRDKWTCIWCGYRSKGNGDIHADHIKSFSLYPELRFAIDNGRTLCVLCHKTTESFLNNKMKKKVYQLAT